MNWTLSAVTTFTLILGIPLINISVVKAATVNIHSLMETMDYEPPNGGGPGSSQGAGTR